MRKYTRKELAFFILGTNVREKRRSADELGDLGKSLRERQLSPVWAKSDGTLLIGYGRLDAAELEGLDALDVIITDEPLTEADVLIIQAQENMLRQDLSDYDKVCIVERLRVLCPKLMAKDLAERLHVSASSITHFDCGPKVIPAVREALEAGAIGIRTFYECSKLPAADQHRILALKLGGATCDAIGHESRKRRNGSKPAVRMNRLRVPLLSGATVTITAKSLSIDDAIEILSESLREAKKGRDGAQDVRAWQIVMQNKFKAASGKEPSHVL